MFSNFQKEINQIGSLFPLLIYYLQCHMGLVTQQYLMLGYAETGD